MCTSVMCRCSWATKPGGSSRNDRPDRTLAIRPPKLPRVRGGTCVRDPRPMRFPEEPVLTKTRAGVLILSWQLSIGCRPGDTRDPAPPAGSGTPRQHARAADDRGALSSTQRSVPTTPMPSPTLPVRNGPLRIDGRLTGYVALGVERGDIGYHRPEVRDCPSTLPRAGQHPAKDSAAWECRRDTDCTESPHGYCALHGMIPATSCVYGCVTDSECAEDELCLCGDPVGRCVPANCRSDEDCAGNLRCATSRIRPSESGARDCELLLTFACEDRGDRCRIDDPCSASDTSCLLGPGGRRSCRNHVHCVH